MNVALLIDKSVPADVATALKETVATAAGVDTTRGDTITSTQLAFAKPETPKAGPVPTTLLGPPSGSAWASPRCSSSSS